MNKVAGYVVIVFLDFFIYSSGFDLRSINASSTDEDILDIINTQLDATIDNTLTVLRTRIDKFGATQPIIQPVKATGRIEVELPGVDDEERVVNQLTSVAKLEFLEVWDANEVQPYFMKINDYLILEKKKTIIS